MESSDRPISARKTVISAALSAWIYRGINLATGMVSLPLIATHLGKEELGVWLLVGNLVSFVSLSDFGIGSSISRLVARYRQTDPQELSALLSTALALVSVTTAVLLLLAIAGAGFVPQLLQVPPSLATDTRLAFLLCAASASLLLVLRLAGGVLAGYQRYGPHATGKVLEALLTFLAVVLLAKADLLDLKHLAVATSVLSLLANAALVWVAWKMTGPWELRWARVSRGMVQEIFSLGVSALGLSLSTVLYAQGIGLLVGVGYGLQAAAIYGVCLLLATNIQALLSSLGVSFSTLASEWQGRNELGLAVAPIRTVSKTTSALASCALAGLIVHGEALLRILFHRSDWSDTDYETAWKLLIVMITGLTVGLPYTAIKSTLLGTGQHWKVFAWSSGAAVGAVAVAAGAAGLRMPLWLIGATWCVFWFLPALTILLAAQARQAGASLTRVAWQVHAPALAVGGLLGTFGFVLRACWPPANLAALLVQILICVGVGAALTVGAVRGKAGRFLLFPQ